MKPKLINVEGLRLYLSGPMTGQTDWNREAFDAAARDLFYLGAEEVYNPADYIEAYASLSHDVAVALSLKALCCVDQATDCQRLYFDRIVLLPGWAYSAGSQAEYQAAMSCGIKTCLLQNVEGITETSNPKN